MNDATLPLILEPEALAAGLGDPALLIVDLGKPASYAQCHVPGAVPLDYARIVAAEKPVMGRLPDDATLSQVLSELGLTPDRHIVAYDDEGGGRAARLLWTLDCLGHARHSLLNGGLHAWANEGFPCEQRPNAPALSAYHAQLGAAARADADYVRERLGAADCALLDARSPDEYHGVKKFAERAGHIPGAVNLEWTQAMDMNRNLRLRPAAELRALLEARGVTPDREVIVYCQTHHRSAHSYIMLKSLGYPRLRGYPGSWSEWGNRSDLPVEL